MLKDICNLFCAFFNNVLKIQTWFTWSIPWEKLQRFFSVKSQAGSLINELAWALNYCSFCHCKDKSIMSSIQSKRQDCSALHRADTLHRPQHIYKSPPPVQHTSFQYADSDNSKVLLQWQQNSWKRRQRNEHGYKSISSGVINWFNN